MHISLKTATNIINNHKSHASCFNIHIVNGRMVQLLPATSYTNSHSVYRRQFSVITFEWQYYFI